MATQKTAAKTDQAPATSTALATSTPSALAPPDILDGMDFGVTGLEEADASDFMLGSILLNFGGLVAGEQVPKTAWFNTLTEDSKKELEVVLLVLHKSLAWTEFVQGEGTKRRCSSWDGVTGKMEDGRERPCAKCPDAQWRQENGKRTRRCGEVHNVVALDRTSNELVMLRAKRTAMDPWKTFLNKFFLGKRVVNGARTNVPLFAFTTKLSAKMEQNGANAYAVPVFDVVMGEGGKPVVMSREEMAYLAETARGVRELYLDRVRAVADQADGHEGGEPDTSFEYGANSGDKFADKGGDTAQVTETRFE